MRLTADCPVLDADVVDTTIRAQYSMPGGQYARKFDFVANRLPPPIGRTYPIGLDTEVCTFTALEKAWQNAT